MTETYAKTTFPGQYAKLERMRQNARSRPLTMKEINSLMSMKFNNQPIFESIELFYSDEYKKALESKTPVAELEKMKRFRNATESEANLLYTDLHAREDSLPLASNSQD